MQREHKSIRTCQSRVYFPGLAWTPLRCTARRFATAPPTSPTCCHTQLLSNNQSVAQWYIYFGSITAGLVQVKRPKHKRGIYNCNYNTQGDSEWRNFVPYLCAGDFCRHLVGKTLKNVCHCDSTWTSFVGNSVNIRTFSWTNWFSFIWITW